MITPADGVALAKPSRLESFRALAALLIALVLWAAAFPAIRVGLRSYGPTDLVALRLLVASATFGIYAAVQRIRLPRKEDHLWFALTGFTGMTGYQVALSIGEMHVSAGSASLIVNTSPVIIVLLAALFLRERIPVAAWLGILVSFGGTALIAIGESHGTGLRFQPAALFVVLAAISTAIYVVLQKPMLSRYTPAEFTIYSVWYGSIFAVPFVPHMLTAVRTAAPQSTWAAIFLGVMCTAAAYAAWSFAFARIPMAKAVSALYLIPIIAIVISFFWLREVPNSLSLLGGLLALSGVVIVTKTGGSTLDG